MALTESVKKIIIVILVIVILIMLFNYFAKDKSILQDIIQNGQQMSVISANTLETNGTNIPSNNFAYSIWFYVNDWNYRYGETKVIFGRMGSSSSLGNGSLANLNLQGSDPCPTVILGSVQNDLTVALSCYPPSTVAPTANKKSKFMVHQCTVPNVPIQSWVNLIVSVYGRTLDIYLNGKLVKTCLLPGIANINNSANVFVTPNGGFNGWTSRFHYWNNPLNPQDAWNVYNKGYSANYSWINYALKFSLLKNGVEQNHITI